MAAIKREHGGLIQAGAAVLLWSTIACAYKLSLRVLAPLPLLCWSATISFLLLCLLRLRSRRPSAPAASPRRSLAASALLGLLNPFLYYLLLFEAYNRLPAQTALALNYTWPLFMALLAAPLLGQNLRLKGLAALAVSFLGVLIIVFRRQAAVVRPADPTGVLLAVGSALCWALYWLLNMRDRREVADKLCLNFLFGACYAWLAALLGHQVRLPGAAGLAGAAWLGVFEMGFTFLLWLRALEATRKPALVANLAYLVPFGALIPLRFILGERILASTFWGLGLIVAGILVQSLSRRKGSRLRGDQPTGPAPPPSSR